MDSRTGMNVVVVESPAKAKTINKYLGRDYTVVASFGHVRDLPAKDGSVAPDDDFAMTWEVDRDANKRLKDIADAVKGSDRLYLATDPDREGEAISWHVLEVLARKRALKDVEVKRVVFNEITKSAILNAIAEPRDLDQELINAYLARRALDYLVGFTLSPVLWRKLPGARSAGRVQSVALRLVCERELEIEQFVSREYWTVDADFTTPDGDGLTARLVVLDGEKLKKMDLGDKAAADRAVAAIKARDFAVKAVEKKPARRHPQPPFTTSTLQQEAARKLGFAASKTMRVAQKLYEGKNIDGETTGLITYMRTDGVSIAQEAVNAVRQLIGDTYGDRYLPSAPRVYKSKARNAQEAHEAIRPTDPARRPSAVAHALDDEERKLYELIWKRTVASQMESARLERTTIDIVSPDGQVGLRVTGAVIQFEGFLKLYQEGRDDAAEDEDGKRLPRVAQGAALACRDARGDQHFTEPPPRFTEASLVKKLEELGIGRPSTYASILSVLRERNYVHMERTRFIPEDKGRLVTAFLESFFRRYVEYDFTASLEEQLDEISAGKLDWKQVLRDFWGEFHAKTEEVLATRNAEVLENLNDYLAPYIFKPAEDGGDPRQCPSCSDGRLSLRTGKFGAFIGCSNYPDCRYTRPFTANGEEMEKAAADGPTVLGVDPDTNLEVTLRTGRFGPYLQLGEPVEGEKAKPKRASIPRDMEAAAIDLTQALALLALPRAVGAHPETGEAITATIGRYGPYLAHNGATAKLKSSDEVFTIGLNRAVALLADAKTSRRGPAEIRTLGDHPDDGEPVKLMDGRYGPYVNHKRLNATLPKTASVDDITLDEALALLKAKAEKGGGRKKSGGKTKAKAKSGKTKSRAKAAAS